MSNYSQIKDIIDAAVYENGQQAITGEAMNTVLNSMVSQLGAHYRYMGYASPSTNPGTPDENVFYFATEQGAYPNFGGLSLTKPLGVFCWDGTWTLDQIAIDTGTAAGLLEKVNANTAAINAINAKIPPEASTDNKLADKAYVDRAVSTNTGTFVGTFGSVSELPTDDVKANDYAYVVEDGVFKRYKYNGSAWLYEYSLDNTAFSDYVKAVNITAQGIVFDFAAGTDKTFLIDPAGGLSYGAGGLGISSLKSAQVIAALGYTPFDASQFTAQNIVSTLGNTPVKEALHALNADTAAVANKVAHPLYFYDADSDTPRMFDGSAVLSVTIPSAAQIALWDKICALFDIDADGNVYVTNTRGFYSNSFLSARGADPEAGGGGTGGLDIDAMWDALTTSGAQKIDASHIPALGLLAGTVSNAQLANSSITIAGVEVPLGSAVSAAQLATALNLDGYLPLTGGTLTGKLNLRYGLAGSSMLDITNTAGGEVYFRMYSGSTYVGAFTANQASYGTAIYNPMADSSKRFLGITNSGVPHFQGNPLLHSGNYTSYTVTKSGGGASGTWPISISGTAEYSTVLSNNASTVVSNYLKYHQIFSQPSLIGSTAVNGAWCLPTTGVDADAKYGNGQILRLGWAQSYYTDIHTGPNGIGNSSGLQFRQVVANKSQDWRILLDTANYPTFLDTRYVKKAGDTMTGTLTLLADGNDYDQGIRINRPTLADWATLTIGCVGSGTNGTSSNTWLIGTPANSNSLIFCLNAASDQKGLCLRDMTNTGILWNGYSVWNAGNHGSGSGLDADMLDGYHASSFQKAVNDHYELNLTSNNTSDGKWNVLLLHEDTLSSAANSIGGRSVQGTFYFYKPSGNVVATINVNSGAGYSVTWSRAAMSIMGGLNGWSNYSFVTCTYKGRCYRAIKFSSAQQVYAASFRGTIRNKDTYFGVFVPYVTTSGTVLDSEVNGSIKAFTKVSETQYVGNIIAPTFKGDLSGNASSATKLATPISIWGQSTDGRTSITGDMIGVGSITMSGNLICGTTISSDIRNSFRSSIFRNSTEGFRIKEVRTDVSVGNFCSIYGSALAWAGGDTHGWLAVGYEANTKLAYIGSGNVDKINWSEQLWHSGNSNLLTVNWAVNNLMAAGQVSANNGFASSKNNTYALTDANTLSNGILAVSTKIVGHDTVQPMITWSNNVSSYGFITRYSISSVRPFGDQWGRMRLAVGANDTGTLIGCYLDIDGDGFVSISKALQVGTDATISGNLTTSGTIYSATGIWSDGYVSAHGVDTTSDRKFKDGITPLGGKVALAVIHALKPSTWTWNALAKARGRSAGFIAQDVVEILPDAIRETGEDKHLALNYQMLHAYEVAALQEHDGEIQRLRRRVAELENKIKDTWHTGQTL